MTSSTFTNQEVADESWLGELREYSINSIHLSFIFDLCIVFDMSVLLGLIHKQ